MVDDGDTGRLDRRRPDVGDDGSGDAVPAGDADARASSSRAIRIPCNPSTTITFWLAAADARGARDLRRAGRAGKNADQRIAPRAVRTRILWNGTNGLRSRPCRFGGLFLPDHRGQEDRHAEDPPPQIAARTPPRHIEGKRLESASPRLDNHRAHIASSHALCTSPHPVPAHAALGSPVVAWD